MKKLLPFLLVLSLVLTSCEIIENILNDPFADPVCQLLKTEWLEPDYSNKTTKTFTYNDQNQLIEIKQEDYDNTPTPYVTRYEMSYTDKKLSKVKQYYKFYDQAEKLSFSYDFYYDGDLIDSVFQQTYDVYGDNKGYYLLNYSGDHPIQLTFYHIDPNTSSTTVHHTVNLTWTGNNVTKVVSQYQNSSPSVFEYFYDDKKAPLTSIGLAVCQFPEFSLISENNVIKRYFSYGSNTPDTTNYELTYNTNDYPASIRDLRTWATYPTNYSYNCK